MRENMRSLKFSKLCLLSLMTNFSIFLCDWGKFLITLMKVSVMRLKYGSVIIQTEDGNAAHFYQDSLCGRHDDCDIRWTLQLFTMITGNY